MSDPIGKLPRSWIADHKALQRFGNDMYLKLRENCHKSHWSTVDQQWLLNRCMEELKELQDAVNDSDHGEIVREAADVANFAMMIADNARGML